MKHSLKFIIMLLVATMSLSVSLPSFADKSEKSEKSEKSSKSDKSDKSNKSEKSKKSSKDDEPIPGPPGPEGPPGPPGPPDLQGQLDPLARQGLKAPVVILESKALLARPDLLRLKFGKVCQWPMAEQMGCTQLRCNVRWVM